MIIDLPLLIAITTVITSLLVLCHHLSPYNSFPLLTPRPEVIYHYFYYCLTPPYSLLKLRVAFRGLTHLFSLPFFWLLWVLDEVSNMHA